MVQLAIRCHPRVPVPADELETWMEQQVDELRAAAPHATLRLSRLTQGGPTTDLTIGWRARGGTIGGITRKQRSGHAIRSLPRPQAP